MEDFQIQLTLTKMQRLYEEKLHKIADLQSINQRRELILENVKKQLSLKIDIAEQSRVSADLNYRAGKYRMFRCSAKDHYLDFSHSGKRHSIGKTEASRIHKAQVCTLFLELQTFIYFVTTVLN